MGRILNTSPRPQAGIPNFDGFRVLTPHQAAAKAIGAPHKSLDKLARKIVREHGYGIAPPMVALGTLKRAVREVAETKDTSGVVSRISQILGTVLRTGIDIELLQALGSPQAKQLGAIAKKYVSLLRDQKLIDREETLLFAAGLEPERQKCFVYGYFRGRIEESRFIDAIAADGSVHFLPKHDNHVFTANRGLVEWFEGQGWTLDASEIPITGAGKAAAQRFLAPVGDPPGNVTALSYSDIEEEIRGTLGEVKRLVAEGARPLDIAVVCRNASQYGPIMAPIADEYGVRMDMTFKIPILETSFGGYVNLLLNTFQEFDFENVLRVFMHPFGMKLSDSELEKAYKFHPRTPEDWKEVGLITGRLKAPERQTRAEWNTLLTDIFSAYGLQTKVAERTREILAYERFLEALKSFCFEPNEELSRDQWVSEILEIMNSVSVSYDPSRGGVAFHDPDTVIGGKFKHMFIVGASEGTLPAGVSENPVVDFHERKFLASKGVHFEGAAEVPRWESMSFYFSLLAASDSVTMSHPLNVYTESRIESPFFDELGLQPRLWDPAERPVSSVRERRRHDLRQEEAFTEDTVLRRARHGFEVEARRDSAAPWDEYDGKTGIPYDNPEHVWSVSQLTTIGQCGFRWFANKLLQLEPIEEMEGTLTPSTRGSLYHRALELAVEKAGDRDDIRAGILEHLEEAFAEAERDPEIALPVLSNWESERREHITILKKAVLGKDFIAEGAKIIATEQKFRSEWKGFKLLGYIDRLDKTDQGIVAIDYKTSSTPPLGAKDSKGAPKLDIQLPLYLESAVPALSDLSGGDGGTGGFYYSLIKGKKLKEVDLSADRTEELNRFAERVQTMLKNGDFSVTPDSQRKVCKYCDFNIVCRDGSRIKRKEGAGDGSDS